MLTSVFRRSDSNDPPPYTPDSPMKSKPPLQKLLLRNLPGLGESTASPASSSRRSVSFADSGSSNSSPVDPNTISLPLPYTYSGRRVTHHDSPERSSSSSPSLAVTSIKPAPRTPANSASRSVAALHLDPRAQNLDDWHRYPLVRQLSPIVEQDYVSPDTLRLSIPLPPVDHDSNSINEPPSSSVIRNGSPRADITRPSPVYSAQPAFLSRQLNRSLSQTSSRTLRSTVSTPISALAPSIPPLDFTPAFPGPHPSNSIQEDGAQPLRGKPGFSPGGTSFATSIGDSLEDTGSLHADSFMTATEHAEEFSVRSSSRDLDMDALPPSPISVVSVSEDPGETSRRSMVKNTYPSSPLRYSQVCNYPEDATVPMEEHSIWETESPPLRPTPTRPSYEFLGLTPACWMFWLGFICPLTWIIGGWYFTIFQETGEDWRAVIRFPSLPSLPKLQSRRSSIQLPPKAAHKSHDNHVLPLWAKRSWSEETIEHLTPQELQLVQRLWTGYPFIEHVPTSRPNSVHGRFFRALKAITCLRLSLIGSPVLNTRRHLDPWIWRCRVALAFFIVICLAVLVVCLALLIPRTHITVA